MKMNTINANNGAFVKVEANSCLVNTRLKRLYKKSHRVGVQEWFSFSESFNRGIYYNSNHFQKKITTLGSWDEQ